jgi:hypothetical protein
MQPYSTQILSYDTARFPFATICTRYLGDLTALHDESLGRLQVGKERTAYHERLYAIGEPFLMVYRAFVRDILGDEAGLYLYQAIPSFRVHLPGSVATGNFHRDSDFNHPVEELNFLVPLTPMRDTSSVWVETEPGANDCQPVTMGVGEYLRFHGAMLLHGSKPNETGRSRVSFDFRVLPKAAYKDGGLATVNKGVALRLGAYYSDGGDLC